MKKHKQILDYYHIIAFMLMGVVFFVSCSEKKMVKGNVVSKVIPLPDALTEIESSDLQPILVMLGDAKIIGVTEGTHYKNESLDFRNELIKFLVSEKRIDVVAIESGLVESRYLFEYVNGKMGDIDSVLFKGMPLFYGLPQNKEIVKWLRVYNSDTVNSHKVKLYGFDVPDYPNLAAGKKNTTVAEAIGYLRMVDVLNYNTFERRLKPYVDYLDINFYNPQDSSKQYIHLLESERNDLTGIINDLIKLYEVNEITYVNKSSIEDYQWAFQVAVGLRQIDNYLRSIPLGYEIPLSLDELASSDQLWKLHQIRDRSSVDNLDWIMNREDEKNILLFAHIYHLTKSPTTIIAKDSSNIVKRHALGQYLASRYGDEYKVIGNYYLNSKNHSDSTKVDDDALANFLIQDASKNYYRLITEDDRGNLNKEWKYGEGFLNSRWYMNPYQGVDVLFFTHTQTQVDE